MVTSTRPLRIASILALVQYSAHAILFLSAKPHGAEEEGVVTAMREHRFDTAGFLRSYWDFHIGYALMVIMSGALEVAALWQLASLAKGRSPVRPLVALFLAANVVHALIAWRYFFLAPVVFDAAVGGCLVWALVASRRPQAVESRAG